ncbi:MAG TPA: NmrA/HSCARG family protein [Gemmatimonadales bacterium]|nr:NmrA/HSCARG family protein [Gemmatimonadales bacterium]
MGPSVSGKLKVLVTGATGKQGGHLVRELLARGHAIRALTRKPDSPAAAALAQRGVTIVTGNFEDQNSLERAARGVDTVFAMSTPFESGAQTETREGINIVRAASTAGVTHLVYTSVAGADRASGIPHFDSKFEVEKEIRRAGVPFTIVAPVFFMENFLADWMLAGITKGSIALALPATRRVQQIAVADIAQFTALAIERRDGFLGKRIDIASDELTVPTAAAAISEASGRRVEYTALPIDAVRQQNDDLARMFEWFDRVGYDADVVGLRGLYPEVDWHRFSVWAREQDWSASAVPATTA